MRQELSAAIHNQAPGGGAAVHGRGHLGGNNNGGGGPDPAGPGGGGGDHPAGLVHSDPGLASIDLENFDLEPFLTAPFEETEKQYMPYPPLTPLYVQPLCHPRVHVAPGPDPAVRVVAF